MRLAVSGYSEEQILDELHASARNVRFRYELLNMSLQYKKDIPTISSASVDYDGYDSIPRTARFEMGDIPMDFFRCRIRPMFGLRMKDGGWAEWPLGVFILATPDRTADGLSVNRSIEAYDLNQILKTDSLKERRFFPSGTFYTDAARNLLLDIGATYTKIPHSEQRLPAAIEFPVGKERLEAINELLLAINYVPIHPDENGIYTTMFDRDPGPEDVEYLYTTKTRSVIKPGAQEMIDYFDVPNRFIAFTSSPDVASLFSIYENDDPSDPLSTRNRQVVTAKQEVSEIADQASLDKYVRDWAQREKAAVYSVRFTTGLMPMHGHRNIYQFEHGVLGVNAIYQETSWSMDLAAGGEMGHSARRL